MSASIALATIGDRPRDVVFTSPQWLGQANTKTTAPLGLRARINQLFTSAHVPVRTVTSDDVDATALGNNHVQLFGETFRFEDEGGEHFLVHPKWSLMGFGNSRANALSSLFAEARELATEFDCDDELSESLSSHALREFLQHFR